MILERNPWTSHVCGLVLAFLRVLKDWWELLVSSAMHAPLNINCLTLTCIPMPSANLESRFDWSLNSTTGINNGGGGGGVLQNIVWILCCCGFSKQDENQKGTLKRWWAEVFSISKFNSCWQRLAPENKSAKIILSSSDFCCRYIFNKVNNNNNGHL